MPAVGRAESRHASASAPPLVRPPHSTRLPRRHPKTKRAPREDIPRRRRPVAPSFRGSGALLNALRERGHRCRFSFGSIGKAPWSCSPRALRNGAGVGPRGVPPPVRHPAGPAAASQRASRMGPPHAGAQCVAYVLYVRRGIGRGGSEDSAQSGDASIIWRVTRRHAPPPLARRQERNALRRTRAHQSRRHNILAPHPHPRVAPWSRGNRGCTVFEHLIFVV